MKIARRLPTPSRAAGAIILIASATLSGAYYSTALTSGLFAALPAWLAWTIAGAVALVAWCLDALKGHFIARAFDAASRLRRLVAGCTALLLVVASMVAVDGMLVKLRVDGVAGSSDAIERHDREAASRKRAADALAMLPETRPVGVIQAEIGAIKVDMAIWRRSQQCQDITREDSRRLCEPVLALYRERGIAASRAELAEIVRRQDAWLASNPRPASADPQIETWARWAGVDAATMRQWVWSFVGLLLEVVILAGAFVASRPMLVVESNAARPRSDVSRPVDVTPLLPPPPPGFDALRDALRGGARPSVTEAGRIMAISTGEASRRLDEWEAAGMVRTRRDGRARVVVDCR